MPKKIILNTLLFRLLWPAFYGLISYIVILLLFNNLSQLIDNFFSQEVLITTILSYIIYELNRLNIILSNRYSPFKERKQINTASQFISGIILSSLACYAIISLYFTQILGSGVYTTELQIFIILFVITSLVYNSIYLGLHFQEEKQKLQLQKEFELRKNLELEIKTFRYKMNPNLLFNSLEGALSLIPGNERKTDELLSRLSSIYRKVLDNQHRDLFDINEEIKSVRDLIFIENIHKQDNIILEVSSISGKEIGQIIPNTFLRISENIIQSSLISNYHKLKINIRIDDKYALLDFSKKLKLNITTPLIEIITELNTKNKIFTDKEIEFEEQPEKMTIKIPLLFII